MFCFLLSPIVTLCVAFEALSQQARGSPADCLFPLTQVRLSFAAKILHSSSHVNSYDIRYVCAKREGIKQKAEPCVRKFGQRTKA